MFTKSWVQLTKKTKTERLSSTTDMAPAQTMLELAYKCRIESIREWCKNRMTGCGMSATFGRTNEGGGGGGVSEIRPDE